jgi:hypothetical protein
MKASLSTITALIFSTALLLSACSAPTGGGISVGWGGRHPHGEPSVPTASKQTGPPDHAPAYGYRARHLYRYYPNERTYYDVERQLYFFFEGGDWHMGATLPGYIRLSSEFVNIELDTDKPYEQYSTHARKYPPGQMKQKQKHAKHKKWDDT